LSPRRRFAIAATPTPPATIATMPFLDGLRASALLSAELRLETTPLTALFLGAGFRPGRVACARPINPEAPFEAGLAVVRGKRVRDRGGCVVPRGRGKAREGCPLLRGLLFLVLIGIGITAPFRRWYVF
jgi:hypothetical protein